MPSLLGQAPVKVKHALAIALLACASGVAAQEPRELCPERPGLSTAACTIEPGRIQLELGLADWTLERDAASRTDTIVAGDALVRIGVSDRVEARVGWTAYGHERVRDRSSGAVDRSHGTGDVSLSLKANLAHPDGSGVAVALLPYATLPTGGDTIGAGTWGAGLLVPVTAELGHGLSLALTPEIDATPDEDRRGRHLAYGGAGGFGYELSDAVQASAELQWLRDEDPSGHHSETLAGLAVAWQPSDDLQLDLGSNAGLNRASADVEVYVGVTRRF